MTKVKEKLYEHRFGLFFFAFSVVCCFYAFEGFLSTDLNTTLSVYAVDFSVGFCNKILPGAIFNAIFKNTNPQLISAYIQVLIYISFVFISGFLEKLVYSFKETERKNGFILSVFLLLSFLVCAFQGIMFLLLDLHWLLSLFLFLFFLSKKQLYVFIPLPFIYAVTVHYGSAMCYIPLFVLIMLVKISYCKEKRERIALWTVLAVSFAAAVAVCLYFVIFEIDNLKVTVDQMHALLESRGVKSFAFYDSYFDTADLKEKAIEVYGENVPEWFVNDGYQVTAENFFPFLIERIKWHLITSDHKKAVVVAIMNSPAVFFAAFSIIKSDKSKIRKLLDFLAAGLAAVILFLGLLLSEDTHRWVGHATICFVIYFAYVLLKDAKLRETATNVIEKASPAFLMFAFIIGFITCRI